MPPNKANSVKEVVKSQLSIECLLGYNLKRVNILFQSDFKAAFGRKGLKPRVFAALSLIGQHPSISQSDLAKHLGIERSGLVAIIDELEGKGYIERCTVPGDRRVHALQATPKGIAACEKALDIVHEHEERMLSPLTISERKTLLKLLKKIRTAEDLT